MGVGVDVVGLVDFMDDIFKDGPELSFPDVMELVLQLRSQNQATVRDIIELRKLISNLITSESKIMMEEMLPLLHEVYDSLTSLKSHSTGQYEIATNLSSIVQIEPKVQQIEHAQPTQVWKDDHNNLENSHASTNTPHHNHPQERGVLQSPQHNQSPSPIHRPESGLPLRNQPPQYNQSPSPTGANSRDNGRSLSPPRSGGPRRMPSGGPRRDRPLSGRHPEVHSKINYEGKASPQQMHAQKSIEQPVPAPGLYRAARSPFDAIEQQSAKLWLAPYEGEDAA